MKISLFFFLIFADPRSCGILVPWPGIEPMLHVVDALSLNHWTTREVLQFLINAPCLINYTKAILYQVMIYTEIY